MTEVELRFLLEQWGQDFLTEVVTEVAKITKRPEPQITLAVAMKYLLKKMADMQAQIKAIDTTTKNPNFDIDPKDIP